MAATIYSEYARDRQGYFFGLTGAQLVILVTAAVPAIWALNQQQWPGLAAAVAGWAMVAVLVVVPIWGRSVAGWAIAATQFGVGTVASWTRFRSRAASGAADDLAVPDLPGALGQVAIHEAPPQGADLTRVAIIQHHAQRTWAVTAAITHPGLALADPFERASQGQGLATLLNTCARTELVEEVQFLVRSVPDDGAEREQWLGRHQHRSAPPLARLVNDQLAGMLSQAAVRTEAFVTVIVPEHRLAREAREFGRGVEGRARALTLVMAEVEAGLRTGLRVSEVEWLTSPQLAAAVRTGFAPGDRAGIIEALAAAEADPAVNADVPWAMAGPSGADLVVRHYSHDAWNSISATIKLPTKGAVIGALAPVLTPTEPGERRSLLVGFPILAQSAADRQTQNAEWSADMGEQLRARAGVRTRAKDQTVLARTRSLDAKLASGNALVRPYAVCAVTVPKTCRIAEFGRRLDASIRRAGFAPLRLDLVQDAGFAAATIPLGISLTHVDS
jgi:hypothetical protein